ncbi:MAG TPA: hypothetical protein DEH78_08545 [Solibacterales bacterium]|nr:hypothetical protein [Bryobacterales bacterium]
MTAKLRVSILATVACFVLAGTAQAQTGSFEGTVKGEDGQPLKDAMILIERLDIKGNYKVKTDKKGKFFHAGLPLGKYKVSCTVNGQVKDTVNGVSTRLGDVVAVDFDLQAQASKQQALAKAAESGTLTQEQARDMSPEAKAQMEKQMKERQAQMAKNKALNDAFNAGMEAIKTKQFDLAVEQLAKASEMDPKQYAVWVQLAEAYQGQAGTKTGDEQTAVTNKSLEAFQKAIELKPDDAGTHNNYGLALARARKLEEAQAELTKAATLDPTQAGKYFFNLGAVLTNTGQLDGAGEAFKKATEADPNYAPAQYQYGMFLVSKATMQGDKMIPPPGTREAFEKYLQLDPNGANAETAKAMIASFEAGVQTQYSNPSAEKKSPKTKKK